jgi:endonuclease YncB( thermonuclease family)
VAVLALLGLAIPSSALSQVFEGPYYGQVVRVIDGDNFEATVELGPTISATISVRIRDIDAPELFRPRCPQERLGAIKAKDDLEYPLPAGTEIRLEDVEADSFSGRVLAVAFRQGDERGRKLEDLMLNRGTVVGWSGVGEAFDWCRDAE